MGPEEMTTRSTNVGVRQNLLSCWSSSLERSFIVNGKFKLSVDCDIKKVIKSQRSKGQRKCRSSTYPLWVSNPSGLVKSTHRVTIFVTKLTTKVVWRPVFGPLVSVDREDGVFRRSEVYPLFFGVTPFWIRSSMYSLRRESFIFLLLTSW